MNETAYVKQFCSLSKRFYLLGIKEKPHKNRSILAISFKTKTVKIPARGAGSEKPQGQAVQLRDPPPAMTCWRPRKEAAAEHSVSAAHRP
jgi:hypothetical protein